MPCVTLLVYLISSNYFIWCSLEIKWAHEQEAWLTAAVASKFLVPCAQEFYKEVRVDAKIPMELVYAKGKIPMEC